MKLLEENAKALFLLDLERYLRNRYANVLEVMGARASDVARMGAERAATYGIVSGYGIRRVTEVMLLLGPRFYEDPRYGWARTVLSALPEFGEASTVQALWANTLEEAHARSAGRASRVL